MKNNSQISERSVGVYEAKSMFSELLDFVEQGRTVTITRNARNIARLVPAIDTVTDGSVFSRIRDMRERLSLNKGESAKIMIDAGRRI
jgi:prevent-host-death family protein